MVGHYLDWSNQGKADLWRYAIAIVLGFILWQFGSIPVLVITSVLTGKADLDSPYFTYTFLPGLIVLFLLARIVLGRPWFSLMLGSLKRAKWVDYGLGVLIGWCASVLSYLLFIDRDRFSFQGWEPLLSTGGLVIVAILVGYAIQTAFEELYFRGLIAQATRRVTPWIPVVIGLQAWLFAMLHDPAP
jgi:uncharacterized protein